MATVQLTGYRCERCYHEWLPRGGEEPKVCPRCKNPYWNRPRRQSSTDGSRQNEEDCAPSHEKS